LVGSFLDNVYKELLVNLCCTLVDCKVTFLLVLVVFFVKILHITPIQDIHVHISACQANWGFEANATDLSSKAQALPIWLSDIIDIASLALAIVCLCWIRAGFGGWGYDPRERGFDHGHGVRLINASHELQVK
jgi:hypothetical protein